MGLRPARAPPSGGAHIQQRYWRALSELDPGNKSAGGFPFPPPPTRRGRVGVSTRLSLARSPSFNRPAPTCSRSLCVGGDSPRLVRRSADRTSHRFVRARVLNSLSSAPPLLLSPFSHSLGPAIPSPLCLSRALSASTQLSCHAPRYPHTPRLFPAQHRCRDPICRPRCVLRLSTSAR